MASLLESISRRSVSGIQVPVSILALTFALFTFVIPTSSAQADETCMSPYMPKITGQEEFIYVWTLGVEGLGDGSDKLVTVDARPDSPTYGTVLNSVSVGGRHEAHHGGFSDDRRHLWLGGLDTGNIFIFDVATDPEKPSLVKTITDFTEASGGAMGPHGIYAMPGRLMIAALSNNKDHGGRTALVEYSNEGEYIATHWVPTNDEPMGAEIETVADGFCYDVRVLPRKNIMLTSSFTGWSNYMMDFGQLVQDPEAMTQFGQTVVVWDLHTRKPKNVLSVPGSPPGNPICLGSQAQLRVHIWSFDLPDVVDLRG